MPAFRTVMIDEGSAQPGTARLRLNWPGIVRRCFLQAEGRYETTEIPYRQTASPSARTAVLGRRRAVRISVAKIFNATQTCRVTRQDWWRLTAFSARTTRSE